METIKARHESLFGVLSDIFIIETAENIQLLIEENLDPKNPDFIGLYRTDKIFPLGSVSQDILISTRKELNKKWDGFELDDLFEMLEILHQYRILSVNYLYTKLSFDVETAKKAIQYGKGIWLNIDDEDGIWIEDEGDFVVANFDKNNWCKLLYHW